MCIVIKYNLPAPVSTRVSSDYSDPLGGIIIIGFSHLFIINIYSHDLAVYCKRRLQPRIREIRHTTLRDRLQ